MNRKIGNKKRRNSRALRRRKTMLIVMVPFVCALAVILLIQFMVHRTISRYDPEIIVDGVKIGSTDVSGMTADEAEQAVLTELEKYEGTELTLKVDSGRKAEATLAELGVSVPDLDKAVDSAVDYGKEGNPIDCYKILKKVESGENQKTFSAYYEVTEESTGSVLEEKLGDSLEKPVDAGLTVENGETKLQEDTEGEVFDIGGTVSNINELIGEGWNKKSGTVEVVLMESEADITAADLEGIQDVLGSYTTYYGEGVDGRTMNVESGASHISGTYMEPGEEVSADALMAPYTEENGYAMAASYENNEVVESMGGGICQVSTTLYNALLLAEVEITERSPHSMTVSYVEPAMDAAIAGDVKDLKFRNNLEDPIYIRADLSGGNITFYIFGRETRPENRTIEYVSETIATSESDETRYVATEDPIGTMYTQSSGHTGVSAQLWKIIYEDGEEVSREMVNESHYMASGKTVAVGTFSDNAEKSAKVTAAIETQDEAQINAAVAEATGKSEEKQTENKSQEQ